jgi:hypothetical protein
VVRRSSTQTGLKKAETKTYSSEQEVSHDSKNAQRKATRQVDGNAKPPSTSNHGFVPGRNHAGCARAGLTTRMDMALSGFRWL